jgi:CRISPR-associated endonuclease/helicase Cas3
MINVSPVFWAKTLNNQPGISVYEHLLNTGYVAICLADIAPQFLDRFQLSKNVIGAIVALHDIGKISPGFQRKCQVWLDQNGLTDIEQKGCWKTETEPDHGKVTHAALEKALIDIDVNSKSARSIATLLGAHHGKLKSNPNRTFEIKGAEENSSGIKWEDERNSHIIQILKDFSIKHNQLSLTKDSPVFLWLAGLTTVADWVGSDEFYFSQNKSLDDYSRLEIAKTAINQIGFGLPEIIKDLSFNNLFDFSPNDLQLKTIDMIQGPGVYVIEAPMGIGKTEAALVAAYKLLCERKATGIYFALPTQATSNRIHIRVNDFVNRIVSQKTINSKLIHGNSWLKDSLASPVPSISDSSNEDARISNRWFSSSKRALLAPFGVGTIDQALLGIVAAKHFFVRHFALAGKVVIIDEVHSYDLYTGTLIDKLVETLKGLGCTVIILSATLTGKRRSQFVSLSNGSDELSYPLISGYQDGKESQSVSSQPPPEKSVDIKFNDTNTTTEQAISAANNSEVVLWICNTVEAAQNQYRKIKETNCSFPVGLLHSRFPFWRREELEQEWMSRLDKSGKTRCGCILVSTQIVEQSVDLDVDLMITELAPTDMLLQRMGRLWRHERIGRSGKPTLIILEETKTLSQFRDMNDKDIKRFLGKKAYVYSPYILLRSLEVWKQTPNINVPTDIRSKIEETYIERDTDPTEWQRLYIDEYGEACAYKQKAELISNIWNPALEDEEGVQTRLNEQPTAQVILCKSFIGNKISFINGETVSLTKEFSLSIKRSIFNNLVRVPKYLFNKVESPLILDQYLYGDFCIGKVSSTNIIDIIGLFANKQISYSDEYGIYY